MRECNRRVDYEVMIIAVLIFLFGLVFLFSASAISSKGGKVVLNLGLASYPVKQSIFGIAGIGLMLFAYYTDVRIWYRFAYIILALAILLLLLVLIFGSRSGGATRWLSLGIVKFQPSEFLKLAIIVYMARSIPNKNEKISDFWVGFFPYFFILSLVAILLFFQRDLGSVVIVGYIVFFLLLVSGAPVRYIAGSAFLGGVIVVLKEVLNTQYRLNRVRGFLFPWEYSQGAGYQLTQSYLALASGGFAGKSPGAGVQKLFYLPEAHTDFIFAVIGEEGGFLIASLFIIAYIYLIYLGFKIAFNQSNRFNMMLALGITALIGIEVFINLGVVTGTLPTKGLPLPLVSYGGSNLLVTFFMIGILARIGRECEKV